MRKRLFTRLSPFCPVQSRKQAIFLQKHYVDTWYKHNTNPLRESHTFKWCYLIISWVFLFNAQIVMFWILLETPLVHLCWSAKKIQLKCVRFFMTLIYLSSTCIMIFQCLNVCCTYLPDCWVSSVKFLLVLFLRATTTITQNISFTNFLTYSTNISETINSHVGDIIFTYWIRLVFFLASICILKS